MRANVAIVAVGLLAGSCARHGPPGCATVLHDSPSTATSGASAGTTSGLDGGDASIDARAAMASGREAVDGGEALAPGEVVVGPMGGPLAGPPAIFELLDGADKLGFVSVPLGAQQPRPLMIAIHGGSEKPQRACASWRGITAGYPFVVCPRGWGGVELALGWRTRADTAARIARAVAATKKAFGSWIKDTRTVVLAGFSMGGSQVAFLAQADPQTYRRIAVGDSAHDPQPALTFSRAWTKGGGERAVFFCTTSGCERVFRAAAQNVATRNAPARLNIAPTQVHGLSEPVAQSMRRDWPWLVEGAEGWETYADVPDAELPGRTEVFNPK